MLHDPRVRKVSFTGSTEVGRVLLAEAADQVVNTSMELGGNAPFLVFADADLDAALDGAMVAKMRNAGEACTAANRFYVEAAVAGGVLPPAGRADGGAAGRSRRRRADPGRPAGQRGRGGQGRRAGRRRRSRRRGRAHRRHPAGRHGLLLPADRADRTSRPTSAILREEIFGPVAPIVTFTDEAEAVRLANDTEFGLVAYVYTGDLARGLRVSEALEAGMVGLNRGLVSDPAAPFGGVKQSGIGREGGHEGMLDYLESKYIAVSW